MHEVVALEPARAKEAGVLLGRAFIADPAYVAIYAHLDEPARLRALTALKTAFVDLSLGRQRVDAIVVDGALAGVALIADPGQYPYPLLAYPRFARATLPHGLRAIRNLLRIDAVMKKHHPKDTHHYLFVLGVLPERQGQGVGRALLSSLAARADAAQQPCYLETTLESNVRIYRAAGFEVERELAIDKLGGVKMWCMRRQVRNTIG